MKKIEERDRRFALNLAKYIEEKGIKQKVLAKDAKISAITLNRILHLKQPAGRKAAAGIAEALGWNSADELYQDRAPSIPDSIEAAVLNAIERASDKAHASRVAAPTAEYSTLSPERQRLIDLIVSGKISDARIKTLLMAVDVEPAAVTHDKKKSSSRTK